MGLGSFGWVKRGLGLVREGERPPRRPWNALALVLLVVVTGACGAGGSTQNGTQTTPVLVAAASNLRFAFEAIADEFERATGEEVILTFGSSGNLAEQIEQGAPYDVYAPASNEFLDRVIEAGRVDVASMFIYATGRLAIRVRDGVGLPSGLAGLTDAEFVRVGIANPAHAPYGIAAREALMALGIWSEIEPRIVFGENVADTLRLVESGNVDAAIVALSLVREGDKTHVVVDEDLHGDLVHSAVVTTNGDNPQGGGRFIEFLDGTTARAVLTRLGYGTPVGSE